MFVGTLESTRDTCDKIQNILSRLQKAREARIANALHAQMFALPWRDLVHWVSLKPDFGLAYRGVDLFKSDFGDGETDFAMFADLLGLWV